MLLNIFDQSYPKRLFDVWKRMNKKDICGKRGVLFFNLTGRHIINGSMLAANVGAMAYFMTEPSYAAGISMLAATSTMSTLMGVSWRVFVEINVQFLKICSYLVDQGITSSQYSGWIPR